MSEWVRYDRDAGDVPLCPECGKRMTRVTSILTAGGTIADDCGHYVSVMRKTDDPDAWYVAPSALPRLPA